MTPGSLHKSCKDASGISLMECGRPPTRISRMAQGKRIKSVDLRAQMAARLRAARMAYNENASEVARQLGVTPQVLNAYEMGRNFPDEGLLYRFCKLTGCTADWVLLGETESAMPPWMTLRIGALFPDLASRAGKKRRPRHSGESDPENDEEVASSEE